MAVRPLCSEPAPWDGTCNPPHTRSVGAPQESTGENVPERSTIHTPIASATPAKGGVAGAIFRFGGYSWGKKADARKILRTFAAQNKQSKQQIKDYQMQKKELCYIAIVAVLGLSLLMGFVVEVFHVDLGPWA